MIGALTVWPKPSLVPRRQFVDVEVNGGVQVHVQVNVNVNDRC